MENKSYGKVGDKEGWEDNPFVRIEKTKLQEKYYLCQESTCKLPQQKN
jgi:hypothetical protein